MAPAVELMMSARLFNAFAGGSDVVFIAVQVCLGPFSDAVMHGDASRYFEAEDVDSTAIVACADKAMGGS